MQSNSLCAPAWKWTGERVDPPYFILDKKNGPSNFKPIVYLLFISGHSKLFKWDHGRASTEGRWLSRKYSLMFTFKSHISPQMRVTWAMKSTEQILNVNNFCTIKNIFTKATMAWQWRVFPFFLVIFLKVNEPSAHEPWDPPPSLLMCSWLATPLLPLSFGHIKVCMCVCTLTEVLVCFCYWRCKIGLHNLNQQHYNTSVQLVSKCLVQVWTKN